MLRTLVILLVLANLASYAWQTGRLAPLGLMPAPVAEPERVDQQLRPEAIRLLNGPRPAVPSTASAAPAGPAEGPTASTVPPAATSATPATDAAAPTACWEAGGFDAAQAGPLRTGLERLGLPEGGWRLSEVASPGRWIVYMGRYDNAAQVSAKKAELRELGVEYRDVSVSGLAPGLSLGTFSSEAAAQTALQQVLRKGVKTARVAQERAPSTTYNLRLPAVTAEQRARVQALLPSGANRQLAACAG